MKRLTVLASLVGLPLVAASPHRAARVSRPAPPPAPAAAAATAGPAPTIGTRPRAGASSPGVESSGRVSATRRARPAAFAVRYRGRESRRRVNPAFVLPGETLELEVAALPGSGSLRVRAPAGRLVRVAPGRWRWTAPAEPGYVPVELVETDTRESVRIAAFVMVPFERVTGGRLDGYRIGTYPAKPFRGLRRYRKPAGFVRVTPENREVRLSPRFTLGQFLCKQPGGFPKYVVLSERLLWKLEALLDELERREIPASGLHVMSGYRSPAYNAGLGQGRYSRHVFGDAADVFVDERPRDGRMDDLNADGRVDLADARVLAEAVEAVERRSGLARLVGGMGTYRANAVHGPFVHVDARGYRARW